MNTHESVTADVVRLVGIVAADWDYAGEINSSTRLFTDINWQSVDMVVLAHDIQTFYKRTFPFAEFFAELGTKENPGLAISELADFIFSSLSKDSQQLGAARE